MSYEQNDTTYVSSILMSTTFCLAYRLYTERNQIHVIKNGLGENKHKKKEKEDI